MARHEEELRDELTRLMNEQIESLKNRTYTGINVQELDDEEKRLKRIREVSAEYLAFLKGKWAHVKRKTILP